MTVRACTPSYPSDDLSSWPRWLAAYHVDECYLKMLPGKRAEIHSRGSGRSIAYVQQGRRDTCRAIEPIAVFERRACARYWPKAYVRSDTVDVRSGPKLTFVGTRSMSATYPTLTFAATRSMSASDPKRIARDQEAKTFYFPFMRAEENSHRNFMPRGLAPSPVHRLEDVPCWTSSISRLGLASSP